MNAQNLKDALLSLEEQLQSNPQTKPTTPQNARNLYFELQRLVHQYESVQVRANSEKVS